MFNEDTPNHVVAEYINQGYINEKDGSLSLTEKGLDEKNRLCTLAGLNIKYQSERAE